MEVIFLFLFKRTTVKRTCIKVLPSLLVIHLMRFGFDWESGRSIKYDEQIRVRKPFFMVPSPATLCSGIPLFLFVFPFFPPHFGAGILSMWYTYNMIVLQKIRAFLFCNIVRILSESKAENLLKNSLLFNIYVISIRD